MRLVLFCLVVASLLLTGPAAADESGLNKEGFWTVGRGDAEAKACMASIGGGDTPMLLIQIAPGHTDFVVGAAKPMRKGKLGVLTVGDQRFEFVPNYSDKRDVMFLEDVGGRALAAMRKARWVSVMVDGRELVSVDLENTGVEGALDATAACTEGKSGWWGQGVGTQTSAGAAADDPLVYHADGIWGIYADQKTCIAQAAAPDARFLQFLAVAGRVGIAVGSKAGRLPAARKVRVQTDSYEFVFQPEYDGAYVSSADLLESPDVFALRRAKRMRMSADGRELIDVELGSSFAEILDSVAACSRGEAGWWGKGASEPARLG